MGEETGRLNWLWARHLIAAARAGGVQDAVLSPGSRSSPLALACERHPRLTTHVIVDERSAAFFALGLARRSGRPVLVVATSGSAPAHWHPAVVEAEAAGIPLLLMSADRPPELHHCGANQTTEQYGILAPHVRASLDLGAPAPEALEGAAFRVALAVDRTLWPQPGPVHLNVPFREPLLPPPAELGESASTERAHVRPAMRSRPQIVIPRDRIEAMAARLQGRRGLIVCGPMPPDERFAAAVSALAARLECPVLADPLSGLRYGGHDRTFVLGHYDLFLRGRRWAHAARPEWVLRFGAAPVSVALARYLRMHREAEHWLVVEAGDWPDPEHCAGQVVHASPAWLCEALAASVRDPVAKAWTSGFLAQECRVAEWLEEHAGALPLEWEVLRRLPALLDDTSVYCGNALVVRDVDAVLGGGGSRLQLFGQRGVSGIDGNLSLAAGLSAAGEEGVVALVGDLAVLHDLTGLGLLGGRAVATVVFSNGGGGIFGLLPQAELPEYERLWRTPQPWSLEQAAQLFRIPYHRVASGDEAAKAILAWRSAGGPVLIDVQIDAERSLAARRSCWRWAEAAE